MAKDKKLVEAIKMCIRDRNGRICMTYSASATGAEYCMGLLSAKEDSDLLDPASWAKERLPVLVTDETACLLYTSRCV